MGLAPSILWVVKESFRIYKERWKAIFFAPLHSKMKQKRRGVLQCVHGRKGSVSICLRYPFCTNTTRSGYFCANQMSSSFPRTPTRPRRYAIYQIGLMKWETIAGKLLKCFFLLQLGQLYHMKLRMKGESLCNLT